MFKNKKGSQKIDSLIGHGTVLTGDMSFAGGLRIDGHVVGNVTSVDEKNGTLFISEKARIEGCVKVGHLILNGEIVGPLDASQYVELQPKARVTGDITYKVLEMHPGAVIEGRLLPLAGARVVVTEDKEKVH